MRLGPTELLIILGIVLLLFGGAKLPQLARGLGQGLKEFKQATRENVADGDEKDKDKDA
jgi:sec-independent protein translocase protein TatA